METIERKHFSLLADLGNSVQHLYQIVAQRSGDGWIASHDVLGSTKGRNGMGAVARLAFEAVEKLCKQANVEIVELEEC